MRTNDDSQSVKSTSTSLQFGGCDSVGAHVLVKTAAPIVGVFVIGCAMKFMLPRLHLTLKLVLVDAQDEEPTEGTAELKQDISCLTENILGRATYTTTLGYATTFISYFIAKEARTKATCIDAYDGGREHNLDQRKTQ